MLGDWPDDKYDGVCERLKGYNLFSVSHCNSRWVEDSARPKALQIPSTDAHFKKTELMSSAQLLPVGVPVVFCQKLMSEMDPSPPVMESDY